MTKERARELFNIPPDEEVPDFVSLLQEEQAPLSKRDMEWALDVAAQYELGLIKAPS